MLRYLAWVLRSLRKDIALRNFAGIWQKTLAQFGFLGQALAGLLRFSDTKLVEVSMGVELEAADQQLLAASCLRQGVALSGGLDSAAIRFRQLSKFAGLIRFTRQCTLSIEAGEVRYSVTNSMGRLRLRTKTAASQFRNPPAAQPLVLRELARLKLIDFDRYLEGWLRSLPGQRLDPNVPVALYLPEVGLRNLALASEPLIPFAGITAEQGWLGCARSYRELARLAVRSGARELTVIEDDAVLAAGWQSRWQDGRKLIATGQAGVVSGLISDLEQLPDFWRLERVGQSEFFVSDRFASTVFTVFGQTSLEWLTSFPSHASNPNTEGVDRYLATMPGLQVGVFNPALVRHDPNSRSTLWRFGNQTYDAQIALAARVLDAAVTSRANPTSDAESQIRPAN